jgi:hypothetical protein
LYQTGFSDLASSTVAPYFPVEPSYIPTTSAPGTAYAVTATGAL